MLLSIFWTAFFLTTIIRLDSTEDCKLLDVLSAYVQLFQYLHLSVVLLNKTQLHPVPKKQQNLN